MNDKKFEQIKEKIAIYKKLAEDEAKEMREKDYNADITFEKGELCAYKMIEELIKRIEEEQQLNERNTTMKGIYDYNNNIKISKSQKDGTYIIRINDAILTEIENTIHEGMEHQKQDEREATANMTHHLWNALCIHHDVADRTHLVGLTHIRKAIEDVNHLTDEEKMRLIEMITNK